MLIWFATMSVVLTWAVFQSPALDYRLVALGSVIPIIEVPFGAGPLHSLTAPTAVLALTMLATQKRRLVRRRWLGVSIGMYLHLVLDAAFTRSQSFWWPFLGFGFSEGRAPELSRGWVTVALELLGLGVGMWAYGRFGLDDPERRRVFLRTGQLDRQIMGETERGC
ncbi:MAG: metal-dependent hydrolase [Microthrixaceae bacterium]